MNEALEELFETFAAVDDEMRLELLLDYAKRLPPLPERFHEQRDAGLNRVPECMTPVFLWIEPDGENVRLYIDVADEAPTVRGLLSIIVTACDGASPDTIAALPNDLLNRLQLNNQIRMNRAIGLSAIIGRIKRTAAEFTHNSSDAHASYSADRLN
jgi:cysteine desulfuration protein SufE